MAQRLRLENTWWVHFRISCAFLFPTTRASRGFSGRPDCPLHPSVTIQAPGSTVPAMKDRSWSPP